MGNVKDDVSKILSNLSYTLLQGETFLVREINEMLTSIWPCLNEIEKTTESHFSLVLSILMVPEILGQTMMLSILTE